MLSHRDFLIYLSLLFNGDRGKIVSCLVNKEDIDTTHALEEIAKVKSKIVTIFDDDFPVALKSAPYGPLVLYYYGDISLLRNYSNCISVIGSRKVEKKEIGWCEKVVKELGKNVTIVSGLAYGIDVTAQRTAYNNGAKTVAVLGCGIDYCYPKEHLDLYQKLKEDGLVISEYPNNLEPQPQWFIIRNRIIAYASRALVVISARKNSGSVTTISFATEADREIFCCPTGIDEDSVCNELIRDGAHIVTCGEDILYYLGLDS